MLNYELREDIDFKMKSQNFILKYYFLIIP